ncbi:ABC transporter ATP-binding protein [Paracoccus shanxieyensis]|uniref:ATP-binding cassette domain-containing protein n=1 Tax=Paracoccus shanxieyensis TaxID=2675752 RepID=A0A6L6IY73_9RHOB|nr:ABC transporter ATP-binding protein [Paracoccus shanxieyensis]MTH65446.1 ATP-binding cassette domain-containing protein [Paracoccus shanxieyensis]MTH88591.1 ATP-binding cassette domain-containing protein [Paracoccus shanxieyensis]
MRITAKALGWRQIVRDVSVEIAAGETFGLVGPNGSGKSTLLRLLAGLLPRAAGQVALDDTPLSAMARRDIARCLAFVEQHADTAEALRVRDAVELGRTPWLSPIAPFGAQDADIVDMALARVDMQAMADRCWATLSGGERQRVHLARALAQQPRVLQLDEPTNHLDIHHQLALMALVRTLPQTVVMAIHDLNQAMTCDRVGVMSGGRMLACGDPAQVLTPELLAAVFRVGATRLDAPGQPPLFRFHSL